MPTTTALGETNKYLKTKHARDPDTGKPVTEPRNFFTNPIKKGANDNVYIGADKKDFINKMPDVAKEIYVAKASYVATGNLYQMPKNVGQRSFLKGGYQSKGGHDKDFMPAKNVGHGKQKTLATYEYICKEPLPKKSYKDPEGGVLVGPRNFFTNPMKKGVVDGKANRRGPTFGGPIPYIESNYNIEKEILTKEIQHHNSLLQEKPWSQRARHMKKWYYGTFNNYNEVMGEDREYPPKKPPAPPNIANVHEGDAPFKPFGTNTNKKAVSCQGTFEIFPGEQKGAIRVVKRVKLTEEEEERPPFRLTNNSRAVP